MHQYPITNIADRGGVRLAPLYYVKKTCKRKAVLAKMLICIILLDGRSGVYRDHQIKCNFTVL